MDMEEGAIIFNDGRKVLILFYSAINILQQVQLNLSKCKCASFFFSGSGPFFLAINRQTACHIPTTATTPAIIGYQDNRY
jgi:hypothetical protein